jgi:muconolactone delta-isomerase
MRFIITGRAIDGLPVPAEQALGAYQASFELLARGDNPAIKGVWPHADQRATTLLVEADTAEALSDILTGLPAHMLSTWEAHPVTTPDHVARSLQSMQAALR